MLWGLLGRLGLSAIMELGFMSWCVGCNAFFWLLATAKY